MKVNSWDCFDTLIARNLITPSSIFDIVGKKIGNLNFTNERKKAEKDSDGTYLDIYKKLSNIDKDLELQTELENCYPIVDNIDKVKDGDYIVSDMYLPESFIRQMLKKCGLKKDVNIIVTKDGKRKGNIWVELKDKILNHTGDNIVSDCRNAEIQGIKSTYYFEQQMNEIEKNIFNKNQNLAGLSRKLRLSCKSLLEEKWIHSKGFFKKTYNGNWCEQLNRDVLSSNPIIFKFKEIDRNENYILLGRPCRGGEIYVKIYKDYLIVKFPKSQYKTLYQGYWENPYELNRIDHRTLWQEQTNINVPCLIIASNILKNLSSNRDYIFNYRDSYFLKKIYDKLWNKNSEYIHSSRFLYYHPTEEYIKYLRDKTKNNNIIVDLQGTGASSYKFFKNNNIRARMIFLYSSNQSVPNQKMFLKLCYGNDLRDMEKFNLYPEGTLIGWKDDKPIRSHLECKIEIFNTQEAAIDLACEEIENFNLKDANDINLMASIPKLIGESYTSSVVPPGPSTRDINKSF